VNSAIHILNSTVSPESRLDEIMQTVRSTFPLPVTLGNHSLDLRSTYDSARGQYNSTALLSQILASSADDAEKFIAIVDVDLYIPVLTFVFGEAQFDGPAAVVSTHRLSNEFYGMPADPGALFHRLEKEVVHELGHTFGLYHCHQFECVMRSSTYVEEIDLKRITLCPSCLSILQANIRKPFDRTISA